MTSPATTRALRARRAAIVLVVAALVGLTSVPRAEAGTYVVTSCAGVANHAWTYSSNTGALENGQACPPDGSEYSGLWVRDIISGGMLTFADGTGAGWTFTAPTGLNVAAITYDRWFYKYTDDDIQPGLRTGDGGLLETCAIDPANYSCGVGTPGGGSPGTFTGLTTPSLFYGVRCVTNEQGVGCPLGGTMHYSRAAMYSSQVTVQDNAGPSIGSPSGSLFAGGWLRGTLAAGAPASDASGVQRERIMEGSNTRANLELACDYTYAKPCSDVSSSPSVSLDTRTLPDGVHQLAVAAMDAASNQSVSSAQSVQVDNTAPTAPVGLAVGEGSPTRSSTISASWSNPGGQFAPIAGANYALCVQGGSCTTGSVTGSSVQLSAPEGKLTLSVWLQDQAGNTDPQSAASVQVIDDRTAPGPPTNLRADTGAASDAARGVTVAWDTPSGAQLSPIASAAYSLCRSDGTGCQSGSTTGSSFTSTLGPGSYRMRVSLADQAGNSNPDAGTAELAFVVPAAPPASGGGGGGGTTSTGTTPTMSTPIPPPPSGERSAGLRLSRVVKGSKLTVTVTASSSATGRVTVAVSSKVGKRTVLSRHRTLTLVRGRARLVVTLPRSARRLSLSARYAGSSTFASAAVSRTLTRR